MKFWKLLLIIMISFSLGIMSSQVFLKKSPSVSKEPQEHHEEESELELTKKSQELIGLKTQEAKLAPSIKKLFVIGQIAQDAELISHILSPQTGVVSECRVEIGAAVKKDDVLCVVKTNGTDSFLEIKSPISGVVIGDFSKVGDKVGSVSSIYTVADLSKLWATFDVYEKDIAEIKIGQKLFVRSIAYPEDTFDGEIIFISPRVDETTRTIKIRISVKNTDYFLKLGMFVTGEIIVESEEKYLTLPAGAVQIMGDRKVVFVRIDSEQFQMKEVKIKSETKDEVAISEGIKEGDLVVTEGAFSLKSELLKDELEGE